MTTYRNYNDACVSQSATKVSKRSRFLPTLDFSETENKQDTEAKITSFSPSEWLLKRAERKLKSMRDFDSEVDKAKLKIKYSKELHFNDYDNIIYSRRKDRADFEEEKYEKTTKIQPEQAFKTETSTFKKDENVKAAANENNNIHLMKHQPGNKNDVTTTTTSCDKKTYDLMRGTNEGEIKFPNEAERSREDTPDSEYTWTTESESGEDEYNDIIEKKTTSIGQGINDAQKNNKEHTFLKDEKEVELETGNNCRKISFPNLKITAPPSKTTSWSQRKSSKGENIASLPWLENHNEPVIIDSILTTVRKWISSIRDDDFDLTSSSTFSDEKLASVSSGPIIDPYPNFKDANYEYKGDVDSFGRPHGPEGIVCYDNGDTFTGSFRSDKRYGYGKLKCRSEFGSHRQGFLEEMRILNGPGDDEPCVTWNENQELDQFYYDCDEKYYSDCESSTITPLLSAHFPKVEQLDGNYIADTLNGKTRIKFQNGESCEAVCKEGRLNGLCKIFDHKGNLKRIGRCINGRYVGSVWTFLQGGSCIISPDVDHNENRLHGDQIAFLYPDMQTALIGSFDIHGKMKTAQVAFIQTATVRHDICQIKFTSPRGPFYSYDPGTRNRISREPFLPDPYETQHCFVRESGIKGAQEGLFTRRDVSEETIIAFYNGIRLRDKEIEEEKGDWEKNAYKILDLRGVDPRDGTQGVLDIPEESISWKNYKSSCAHKSNHSFEPNAKFVIFHHPRFGRIPAITTIKYVLKDCEILVSYDYAMEEAPPWYQELFSKRILEQYKATKEWNGF